MAEKVDDRELPLAFTGKDEHWPVPREAVYGARGGWLASLESRVVLGAFALLRRLPEGARRALIGGVSRLAPHLDRRHADAARVLITQALGEMPRAELERRVRETYAHLARVIYETEWLVHHAPDPKILDRFEIVWTDEARAAFEAPGGRVIVSGHIGNWEAGLAVSPWLVHPAYVISKPPKNRPLSEEMQRRRERLGIRLIPRRGAMTTAPAILKAGGSVAMLLDQRARKRPILAPYFGRPARCDRSAGVLVRRLKVPVVLLATYRAEKPLTWRLEFFDVIGPEEVTKLGPVGVATRINASLEKMIRKEPEQNFWLHDRYRDTPETFPDDASTPP